MNLGFVYDLHCLLKQSDFSYVYNGDFSQELTDRILSFAESAVDSHAESTKVKKKLYFVMVESLQNVARHSEAAPDTKQKNASSFFIIQSLKQHYYLTSANSIDKKDIEPLREKLEHVNSLDKDALKLYSNEILTQGAFSEKGGAGLGLVEMARKSGNKLAFDFSDINNAISYFYFQLKISSDTPELSSDNNLADSKKMHQLMAQNDLSLIYSGDFTQEIVKGILAMTEASIQDQSDFILRNKIFNIVVELLQNVFQHADDPVSGKEGKTGMFLIGEKSHCYVLTSSNLVLNSKTAALQDYIEEVNSLTASAIDKRHTEALSDESSDHGTRIGYVDMRIKSNSKIEFQINKLDQEYSFFTVQVKVTK